MKALASNYIVHPLFLFAALTVALPSAPRNARSIHDINTGPAAGSELLKKRVPISDSDSPSLGLAEKRNVGSGGTMEPRNPVSDIEIYEDKIEPREEPRARGFVDDDTWLAEELERYDNPKPPVRARAISEEEIQRRAETEWRKRATHNAKVRRENLRRLYQPDSEFQEYHNTIPEAAYKADDGSFSNAISEDLPKRWIEALNEVPDQGVRDHLEARLVELGYIPENYTGKVTYSEPSTTPSPPPPSEERTPPNTSRLAKRDIDPHIGCPSLALMGIGHVIFFNPDAFTSKMREFRNSCFKCGCRSNVKGWFMAARENLDCTPRLVTNCLLAGCLCTAIANHDEKFTVPKPTWTDANKDTKQNGYLSVEYYDPLKDTAFGDLHSAQAAVDENPLLEKRGEPAEEDINTPEDDEEVSVSQKMRKVKAIDLLPASNGISPPSKRQDWGGDDQFGPTMGENLVKRAHVDHGATYGQGGQVPSNLHTNPAGQPSATPCTKNRKPQHTPAPPVEAYMPPAQPYGSVPNVQSSVSAYIPPEEYSPETTSVVQLMPPSYETPAPYVESSPPSYDMASSTSVVPNLNEVPSSYKTESPTVSPPAEYEAPPPSYESESVPSYQPTTSYDVPTSVVVPEPYESSMGIPPSYETTSPSYEQPSPSNEIPPSYATASMYEVPQYVPTTMVTSSTSCRSKTKSSSKPCTSKQSSTPGYTQPPQYESEEVPPTSTPCKTSSSPHTPVYETMASVSTPCTSSAGMPHGGDYESVANASTPCTTSMVTKTTTSETVQSTVYVTISSTRSPPAEYAMPSDTPEEYAVPSDTPEEYESKSTRVQTSYHTAVVYEERPPSYDNNQPPVETETPQPYAMPGPSPTTTAVY